MFVAWHVHTWYQRHSYYSTNATKALGLIESWDPLLVIFFLEKLKAGIPVCTCMTLPPPETGPLVSECRLDFHATQGGWCLH